MDASCDFCDSNQQKLWIIARIVDLPHKMVIFHGYVSLPWVYQRWTYGIFQRCVLDFVPWNLWGLLFDGLDINKDIIKIAWFASDYLTCYIMLYPLARQKVPWVTYPLANYQCAMENGPFIDGLPMQNGDFLQLC